MIREKNRYWISYGSRWNKTGIVHKELCRWAGRDPFTGFWVDGPEDIPLVNPKTNNPLNDCGVCGGKGPRP